MQVIQNAFHLAQVTGKRSHLEAALDDPAVRQISRIPGNLASTVFGQRLAELNAPARDRQLDGSANLAAMSPAVSLEAQPATQSVVAAPSPTDSLQRNPPRNETGSAARPFELPMTRAEARRRYGEIRPASDRVGPPLPLTVKNVAAVTADAIAKTAVGLAKIGNFADPPRGNLHEIGTGFGIARTAAGDAIGVDVNNPRFGVTSDLLPFAAAIAAKPRTFTRNDVKAALERLDKKGLSASDMQGYIDPDHVIRLAEQMLSGEFRNTLMTSPVIREGRLQVAGHHRQVAAEMANFPLEVKALPPSSSVRGQAWGNLPLQPGRRK